MKLDGRVDAAGEVNLGCVCLAVPVAECCLSGTSRHRVHAATCESYVQAEPEVLGWHSCLQHRHESHGTATPRFHGTVM